MFVLGFIASVVICVFIAVVLIVFRRQIEHAIEITEQRIDAISPVRPRGFIWEPESEADEARAEKIRENAERGMDTPLEDLR
jgi:hypothetical protein